MSDPFTASLAVLALFLPQLLPAYTSLALPCWLVDERRRSGARPGINTSENLPENLEETWQNLEHSAEQASLLAGLYFMLKQVVPDLVWASTRET